MGNSKASLPTLSLDLLIQIMQDLHVIEIIALRLTCKALYHATHERFVWLKELKNSCERNYIFQPTFPFDKMSQAELERASTTPHRSLRVMTHGPTDQQGSVHQHNIRKILRATHPSIHHPAVYLVPGGRFLFHFSDKIALYDLGYPGAPLTPIPEGQTAILTPKATCELEASGRGRFWIYSYGDALRILQDRRREYGTLEFALLEIYPQHDKPEFTEITRYTPTDHWSCVALHRDNFFFIQDEKMNIVNLTNDKWTWWSLNLEHNYQHIIVRETDILTIHDDGAEVWPYPILDRTSSPMFEGECLSPEPRYSLGHMDDPNIDYQMGDEPAQVFSEWYTGHDDVPFIWDKPQWTIVSAGESEDDGSEGGDNATAEGGSNSGSSSTTPQPKQRRDSVDPDNPRLDVCRYELRVGTAEDFDDDDGEDRDYTTCLDNDYDRWEGEPISGIYSTCTGNFIQPLRLCEEAVISLWGNGAKPVYVNVNSVPHLARAADYVPISTDEKKVALLAMGDYVPYRFSFCPYSGRCAHVKVDTGEVDGIVTVFDLV